MAEFLSQERQLLLPMLEPIEQAELAMDELIDVMAQAGASMRSSLENDSAEKPS